MLIAIRLPLDGGQNFRFSLYLCRQSILHFIFGIRYSELLANFVCCEQLARKNSEFLEPKQLLAAFKNLVHLHRPQCALWKSVQLTLMQIFNNSSAAASVTETYMHALLCSAF